MAWIESHQEMKDNPKVIRLARRLKIEVPHAIGCLHCLWWWAINYAQDGTLYKYDNLDIAYAMMWKGDPDELVEALKIERFLDVDESGYSIHNWWNYAGKLLEKRRNDSERKKNAAGMSADKSRDGRGASTEQTRNFHGSDAEEKRNSTVPNSTVPNNEEAAESDATKKQTAVQRRFDEFWALYPNKKAKQDAIKAWGKIKPDEALFSSIMDAVREQLQSEDWRKENGRFIPHPATWLNSGRWDDVVKPTGNTAPPQQFKPSTGGRSFYEYRNDDEKP
jgi:hypothetical protein